jgi:hypothetical protein
MKKQLFRPARLLTLALVLLIISCSKNELNDSPTSATKSTSPGVARISFDAEAFKLSQLADSAKASAFEKTAAAPRADRQKIDIDIYEDGTSAWVMEKQQPKNDVKEHHLTPVDTTIRETQTTRIDRAGNATYYDNTGSLIRQHKLTIPSFNTLANEIKRDPSAAFGAVGVPSAERLKQLLSTATASGAIIQDLGNGKTSIRTTHTTPTATNAAAKTTGSGNYHSVDIIDTRLNLVLGSTLYDANEEVVSKAYYAYTFENQKARPKAIYSEIWNTDKNGNKVKSISNTYFYQFSATVNN